jgi:hypothetical protein
LKHRMCKRSPRGVFLGNLPGGAIGSAQIHDWLDIEGDSPGEGKRHSHAVRAEHMSKHPIRWDSFPEDVEYPKLFFEPRPVTRIRGATGKIGEFIGDRPVRVNKCG